MKFYKQIAFILIVFFKTETLLSENNLFNVNNILLEKKEKITNIALANKAIKNGFNQLTTRILLDEDKKKLSTLDFLEIKKLVTYYQVTNDIEKNENKELLNFSVTFDKSKIHDLFYRKAILYSEILDKELYIIPLLVRNDEINIFNNNFFYENWNKINKDDLLEFILLLENIEIIQNINSNKKNLINLKFENLFKEYLNKNLALVLIEGENEDNIKVYIKSKIQGKNISKSLNIKNKDNNLEKYYENIIKEIKKELTNLVKSENLIDIRTPSFLNVKLDLNKKSNLVELNKRIKKIDLIDNLNVQEFNKDYMLLRIKYLGKLEKIIDQLQKERINLELTNDQWIIKTL
jgi:hypothetical protein|tara:strand:- start:779 stop:1825 length:1047 start_codon:yes stop_codon:yes gene_type:complete